METAGISPEDLTQKARRAFQNHLAQQLALVSDDETVCVLEPTRRVIGLKQASPRDRGLTLACDAVAACSAMAQWLFGSEVDGGADSEEMIRRLKSFLDADYGHHHEQAFKWNVACALRIVERVARAQEQEEPAGGSVVDLVAWRTASAR